MLSGRRLGASPTCARSSSRSARAAGTGWRRGRRAPRKRAGELDFVYARHRYRLPGGPPRVVARVARPHMEEISLGVRGRGGSR